jgi:hypothetical protein
MIHTIEFRALFLSIVIPAQAGIQERVRQLEEVISPRTRL